MPVLGTGIHELLAKARHLARQNSWMARPSLAMTVGRVRVS